MQGRLHGYEGYSAQEVAYPVWLMHSIGVRTLLTTNAASTINEGFEVGDFCVMSDHINFTGRNPVRGVEPDKLAMRFFSMLDCYDPALREVAKEVAASEGIPLREGVYLGLLGPSFETAAEIRTFRGWGADTVAMSVCEEVIAARHVGMRVLRDVALFEHGLRSRRGQPIRRGSVRSRRPAPRARKLLPPGDRHRRTYLTDAGHPRQ